MASHFTKLPQLLHLHNATGNTEKKLKLHLVYFLSKHFPFYVQSLLSLLSQ